MIRHDEYEGDDDVNDDNVDDDAVDDDDDGRGVLPRTVQHPIENLDYHYDSFASKFAYGLRLMLTLVMMMMILMMMMLMMMMMMMMKKM